MKSLFLHVAYWNTHHYIIVYFVVSSMFQSVRGLWGCVFVRMLSVSVCVCVCVLKLCLWVCVCVRVHVVYVPPLWGSLQGKKGHVPWDSGQEREAI